MHSRRGGKLYDQRQVVDFILQDQPVSRSEATDHMPDVLFRNRPVGSAIEQDAVFPFPVDLYACMTLHLRNGKQVSRVHSVIFQGALQYVPSGTETAGVKDRGACPGQRDGLIQPFAPGLVSVQGPLCRRPHAGWDGPAPPSARRKRGFPFLQRLFHLCPN